MFWRPYTRRLDLQAKIILVLIAVILPTHLLVTFLESQLTTPVLEQEMRQVGINTAKNLTVQIVAGHILQNEKASAILENMIQELLFLQPSIQQVDVFRRQDNGSFTLLASNVEYENPSERTPQFGSLDTIETTYRTEEGGAPIWEITVPIRHRSRFGGPPTPVLGAVRMEMSLKPVHSISRAFWKITVVAALVNLTLLLFALSYFLRRTLHNDRLLRQAENQNIELSSQLRDAERQLMLNEKLAVMGQLTASFAHEIGTPLNAMSGHLQLLQEELKGADPGSKGRLEIISVQLLKIERIVKNFLQSTAKPSSQNQLIDLNQMLDRVSGIVRPRIDGLGVQLKMSLEKGLGPIRAVPLDIEQILMNFLNNSLDSLQAKKRGGSTGPFLLHLESKFRKEGVKEWAELSVYDTGEGIEKENIKQVFKPFFTTKRVGEGTGLGLTICQQIAAKYNGVIQIESKVGAWTRVTLRIPYRVQV